MKNESTILHSLASIILPQDILNIFDITKVEVEHTGVNDERGLEIQIINISLDERDLREVEWHDLKPNGFTETRKILDFPIRDHQVILHVRRRRWLDADGHNVILDYGSGLVAPGTSYSVEFADALKKICGYIPNPDPFT